MFNKYAIEAPDYADKNNPLYSIYSYVSLHEKAVARITELEDAATNLVATLEMTGETFSAEIESQIKDTEAMFTAFQRNPLI